jgi:hypothetical protein
MCDRIELKAQSFKSKGNKCYKIKKKGGEDDATATKRRKSLTRKEMGWQKKRIWSDWRCELSIRAGASERA